MDDVTLYFEGWTQAFQADNEDSDPRTMRVGVPQGLVAGPQTFVCYLIGPTGSSDVLQDQILSVCRR